MLPRDALTLAIERHAEAKQFIKAQNETREGVKKTREEILKHGKDIEESTKYAVL
jgi:hypothetical protein